jgi:hypothetical protein
VTFEATGAPTWTAGCCCRDCARATGTPFVVWVGFPVNRVNFETNQPKVVETSTGVLRGFCDQCGASITYGRDPKFDVDDPLLYVAATTLDDPERCPPTEVVWYSQRPSWFELERTVPLHDGASPSNSDRAYNAAVDRQ